MALAQHFIANNGFNPVNNPLNTSSLAGNEALLQTEAFPGELASLRAQLSQVKSPNDKTAIYKRHKDGAEKPSKKSGSNTTVTQNPMADQLIEMMPTGLVMLDGNGVVVKINKVARSLLEEPILGQPWFSVIARSFKPRADDWHEVSLKDGRRVKLEITSLGNQPGQLIMITDLTETRLLQDKVGQMQRLSSLGRMISTLAHQIRTPLSAAMLYSANLSSRKLSDAARGTFQEKLNLRLQDLEQQINDMLLFSKSGNEQVVSSLPVNSLINDAVQTMDALIAKANMQVNMHLTAEEHHILGNKNALTGAIQNLVHNTLQATSSAKIAKPVINIQVYRDKKSIYISVKDNGPGISSTEVEKIFEPFYTSSSKGTGLGLAVVKSVIEAHQGKVNYLSQLGEGAHFCLKLPLIEQVDTALTTKVSTEEN